MMKREVRMGTVAAVLPMPGGWCILFRSQPVARTWSSLSDPNGLMRQLEDFDPAMRRQALERLAAGPSVEPVPGGNVNLHFHSFFSYNAEGWSPSHIVWAARQAGLYAAGLCDFDVLDGLEEFLAAGELLGLRVTANLETRVYVKEYAEVDISSPGEPGVTYIMGAGFARPLTEGSPQAETLRRVYREGAKARNIALVERINDQVPQIAVDYDYDVLPLTPAGAATERHIIRAYVNKAEAAFGDGVAAFWAGLLGKSEAEVAGKLGTPTLEEWVRSKLAKRGGLGYIPTSPDTFPPVEDFCAWVLSCRAMPMITWLDGTSGGEADARGSLELMMSKGCVALNIIPDRNWNLKDPPEQATKVANLEAIMGAANDLHLPINIGTEMNRAGLPFVDDLSGPVLSRHRESFLLGARVMVGQTILFRHADFSYVDDERPVAARNAYFAAVGALPPLTRPVAERLQDAGSGRVRELIEASAAQGEWV